jgi:MFS transporter, ACS family, hexuronate transporter
MLLPAKQRRVGAWTWFICGILFLATVLNYLDRQTMALCAPLISEEFGLNNEQWGGLLSAFRWTYAFMQIPAGYLADRFSVRIVYALAVGLWSAAGAAAAFTGSARALGWTRRALGVGESFNWPCALRVTANMLPPEDRGLANGIFAGGSAMGAFLAPFLITPLAKAFGWRTAFFAIGGLGALWILLWWAATRGPGTLRVGKDDDTRETGKPSFLVESWKMLTHPGFWLLLLVASTINPCTYVIADWIPKYMHDQRGFGLVTAGLISAPIFLGEDLGNIGGGALVKYLTGRGLSLRLARGITVGLAALLVLPAAGASFATSPQLCVALLVVGTFALCAISANYLAALQDISFASVGLVAGYLGALSNMVGATVNPLIGHYVDTTGHYHLVFILLAVFPLIGMSALLVFDAVLARRRARSRGGEETLHADSP